METVANLRPPEKDARRAALPEARPASQAEANPKPETATVQPPRSQTAQRSAISAFAAPASVLQIQTRRERRFFLPNTPEQERRVQHRERQCDPHLAEHQRQQDNFPADDHV